ncbi:recombination protein NinG, partial [Brucella abortus]|uniref:recombination protein NinG n=1 Tax=Brucella abortus TaxID=235 RepID=UPI001FFE24BF
SGNLVPYRVELISRIGQEAVDEIESNHNRHRWISRKTSSPCICLCPGNCCGTSTPINERNIHKQCVVCNQHKSGNLVPYRVELISRIGQEAVDEIESNHNRHRW